MILGLGFDLVEIERVERLIANKGARALDRLFSADEVAYAMARARPAMHLAARLAAKEATFKALTGTDDARLIGWRDAEVVPRDGHGPILRLTGRAEARAAELGVRRTLLTLTHTDTTAGAVVILSAGE